MITSDGMPSCKAVVTKVLRAQCVVRSCHFGCSPFTRIVLWSHCASVALYGVDMSVEPSPISVNWLFFSIHTLF